MTELNDKIINFKDLSRFKTRYDEKIENENKILKANIKALEYVVNNSNRLNYTGQVITNSNSVVGDIKNVTVRGNTRYKKTDGTYTDTWESGVSLESVGEKEKNSDGKYPIVIKSSNDTKENKRTILLDKPLKKVSEVADELDLNNSQVIRKCKTITIDGSSDENWDIDIAKTDIILFYSKNIITENAPKNYDIHLISDKFSSFRYDDMWNNTNEGISVSNNTLRINISKSKLETQDGEGLKKWLASNPVTIIYELATPTTEIIEILPTDNPLTSYNDSTTLTLNNTIKGNISADIPTNVNAIIVNQASEIAKLKDDLLKTQAVLVDSTIE